MTRSITARSNGKDMSNFVRNLIFFPKWLHCFAFHQQLMRVLIALHSCQYLLCQCSGFGNLNRCALESNCCLICTSLIIFHVSKFLHAFLLHVSVLMRHLLMFMDHFKWVVYYFLYLGIIWLFWLTVLYQMCLLQMFSPWHIFSFSWQYFFQSNF